MSPKEKTEHSAKRTVISGSAVSDPQFTTRKVRTLATEQEALKTQFSNGLKGPFDINKIRILELTSEQDEVNGNTIHSGEIIFYDIEMQMEATVSNADNQVVTTRIYPAFNNLARCSFDLIGEFLAGNTGIDGGHTLSEFFPDNFPTDVVNLKEIALDFSGNVATAIQVIFGTNSNWTILNTNNFVVNTINVTLTNDNFKGGFKNTALGIQGLFSVENQDMDLTVGNIVLSSPAEVLREIELSVTLLDVDIPVAALMRKILPPSAYSTWQELTPSALQNPHLEQFTLGVKPENQEFYVLLDSNLGGFEVIGKRVAGTRTGQRNILIALTPPASNNGTFFGDIGRQGATPGPLAKLDTLDLRDSGIIFSTLEDAVTLSLPAINAHQTAADPLEVIAGIQFFANIRFRNPNSGTDKAQQGEDEKILRDTFNLGDTYFTLYGSIEQDLTATLEVGVNFGKDGFKIIPEREELILREISIGLILQPVPGYVGFRVGGVLDTHLKFDETNKVELRFGANMEFGILAVGPTLVLGGGLEIMALDGITPSIDGEPVVWEDAFGIPGLGFQEIGGDMKIGLILGTVLPTPTLKELGLKGTLMFGTIEEERVYASADIQMDVNRPTDSLIEATVKNTSLIDLIEAYVPKKDFNISGPLREILNVGFKELEVKIDPPNKEFYFNTALKLGILKGNAEVHFQTSGIKIEGTVDPMLIEIPGTSIKLFEIRGATGTSSRPTLEFNLDFTNPAAAKFLIKGEVAVLGGDVVGGRAEIEITPQNVFLDTKVHLFGGAFKAGILLEGQSFTADGTGMYARVNVENDVLSSITTALGDLMDTAYEKDRQTLNLAKTELANLRTKSAFEQAFVSVAQFALDGIKKIQDIGVKIGSLLLDILEQGFNIDHIRFEGDLDVLGNSGKSGADIEAEVQLTLAGQVINKVLNIDFDLDIAAIAKTLKEELLNVFDYLEEEFDKIGNEFAKIFEQFEKWGQAIADFVEQGLERAGEFFAELFKDIADFFEGIGDFFDNLFNGEPVTLPQNGRELPYPIGVRHYSVKLNYFSKMRPGDDTAKVYGYVVMKPNDGQIKLGGNADGSNVNLIAFSARKGLAPDPDPFDGRYGPLSLRNSDNISLGNTKHFYVPDDGRDYKVTFICALSERGDGVYTAMPGHSVEKTINLGGMEWKVDEDTEATEGTHLVSDSGEGDFQIYLNFKATLHGKISAETMRSHIDSFRVERIAYDFNHGADPNLPGLMDAAITSRHGNYLARMNALFDRGVMPISTNIATAIGVGRWEGVEWLLEKGAKPLATDITLALNKNVAYSIFEKLLKFKLVLTNQMLVIALTKNDLRYATALIPKSTPIEAANLIKVIEIGNLDLLRLMLRNVGIEEVKAEVFSKAIEKGKRNLLLALLKKPITDQLVYQTALEKIGAALNATYFNDFITAGARLRTNSIIDNMLNAFSSQNITQALVNAMLVKALKFGGDATYALEEAVAPKFSAIANWNLILQACLDQGANPNKAINYAIDYGQIDLLKYIFNGTTRLFGKATSALKLIIEKTLTNAIGNQRTEQALVKVVLDVGADPNVKINTGETLLIAIGKAKRYDLVTEFLQKPANTQRLEVKTKPSVFLAIQEEDKTLLTTLVNAKVSLAGDPAYVLKAVEKPVSSAFLKFLLDKGAPASTAALAIVLQPIIEEKAIDSPYIDILIDAGARGELSMIADMMRINNTLVLGKLLKVTPIDASSFQLAADLNNTEFFTMLAETGTQLRDVGPLKTAIDNRNLEILPIGLAIGWPSTTAMATDALVHASKTDWIRGIIVCLEHGANPTLAVTHAIRNANAYLLERTLEEFAGNPNQALAECMPQDKDFLLPIILEAGADPNLQMVRAADAGEKERVRLFLDFGAKADPAMLGTIRNEIPSLVQDLIDKGADATKPWYLAEALVHKNVEIIGVLIDYGARVTPPMLNQMMEADHAASLSRLRLVTVPNLANFQLAANLNRTDFFQILAKPNGKLRKLAPLETALGNENADLLNLGLSIGYPDPKPMANTLLPLCIQQDWNEGIATCLAHGADKPLAVSHAVKNADADLLEQILVDFQGDANQALSESLDLDRAVLLPIALQAGADPNLQMERIANAGQEGRVRQFLRYGATPDLAMAGTIKSDNPDLIKHLMEAGADATKLEYLDLAIEEEQEEIVQLLLGSVPSPIQPPKRQIDLFSQMVLLFGGLYATLGWFLAFGLSITFWVYLWNEASPSLFLKTAFVFTGSLSILCIIGSQVLGSTAVKLLNKGEFAWGIIPNSADTNPKHQLSLLARLLNWGAITWQNLRGKPITPLIESHQLKFFGPDQQPYFTNIEVTSKKGFQITDRRREGVLFLARNPKEAIIFDSIQHTPIIGAENNFLPLPYYKGIYFLLPFMVCLGNAICIFLYLIG